jgi:hypothetical protein
MMEQVQKQQQEMNEQVQQLVTQARPQRGRSAYRNPRRGCGGHRNFHPPDFTGSYYATAGPTPPQYRAPPRDGDGNWNQGQGHQRSEPPVQSMMANEVVINPSRKNSP